MESNCSDDSPECWCPCGCGCQNDPNGQDLPFTDRIGGTRIVPCGELGLCASCAEGNHEIAPAGVQPDIDNLIAAHKSVLAAFLKVKGELL
jgi:hypothetical protein